MTHDERVHYHMYESLEGIAEHAERIVALEELAHDLWHTMELLDACRVNEYDEPLNCMLCDQYDTVDGLLIDGKHVIGCKLQYRMQRLGVDG